MGDAQDWMDDAAANLTMPFPPRSAPGQRAARMLVETRDRRIVDLATVVIAAENAGIRLAPLGMRAPALCSCGRWFSTVDEGECVHPDLEDHPESMC